MFHTLAVAFRTADSFVVPLADPHRLAEFLSAFLTYKLVSRHTFLRILILITTCSYGLVPRRSRDATVGPQAQPSLPRYHCISVNQCKETESSDSDERPICGPRSLMWSPLSGKVRLQFPFHLLGRMHRLEITKRPRPGQSKERKNAQGTQF